ncbi:MAG: hypothetical protein LBG96_07285, partial [Tannerella sp.]|nr:hypothetical protein [Tannerella sp.]
LKEKLNIGNRFEKGVSSENLHLSFCNTQKKVAAFPSKGSIIDYRNTTLLHEYGITCNNNNGALLLIYHYV